MLHDSCDILNKDAFSPLVLLPVFSPTVKTMHYVTQKPFHSSTIYYINLFALQIQEDLLFVLYLSFSATCLIFTPKEVEISVHFLTRSIGCSWGSSLTRAAASVSVNQVVSRNPCRHNRTSSTALSMTDELKTTFMFICSLGPTRQRGNYKMQVIIKETLAD